MQTGFLEPNEFPRTSTGATPSAIALTGAALDWRFRPREDLVGGFAYGFDQLAYLSSAAADRSLQQHLLSGGLELSIRDYLRIGGSIGGQLAFTGLSGFRGLQAGGGAGTWAALDESDFTTTRLDLEWAHKVGLTAGFGYLTGDRADASLSQELRLGLVTVVLGDRFRAELIGTSRQPAPFPPAPGECPPPGGCTQEVVDPFRYAGNTVWLSGRAEPLSRLALELSGGFEQRNYLDDNSILLQRADGTTSVTAARRRHDRRWFAGASAGLRLSRALSLFLRYDLVVNRSNISSGPPGPSGPGPGPSPGCAPANPSCDNRSYDKNVLTFETVLSF